MLTYKLQERVFQTRDGTALSFPNKSDIRFELHPPVPFGGTTGPSRNVVPDREVKLRFNVTVGRVLSEHQDGPLFDPVDVSASLAGLSIHVLGNVVTVKCQATSPDSLHELISALFHILPTMLTVYVPDVLTITKVYGEVGGKEFRWVYDASELRHSVVNTSKPNQECIIRESLQYMELFNDYKNGRLLAALHYFHVACRLLEAGVNRFEFLAEAILNYSKSIQALFGESRDDVRTEIAKLDGYTTDEIETKFVTALVLRSYFDVAHISLAMLDREQLSILQNYCRIAENSIRDLLKSTIEGIAQGAYEPHINTPEELSSDKASALKMIQENMEKVCPDP